MTHLVVRDVTFGHASPLTQPVTFEVASGQALAVLGRNGAGKTTLLHTLAGLRSPLHGTVTFDNTCVHSWPPRMRAQKLAFLPQRTELYTPLRVRDAVALGTLPQGGTKAIVTQRVMRALARVHASDLADRAVHTLSGGEQQKVWLARMLAQETKLLIVDEPTASLDLTETARMAALLRALVGQGASVVFSTHDVQLVRHVATTVVLMTPQPRWLPTEQAITSPNLSDTFGMALSVNKEGVYWAPHELGVEQCVPQR